MSTRVLVVARASFQEAVRSRLFLNLLAFYSVLLLGGAVVDAGSMGDAGRVFHDIAHAALSISGSMVAIFVGIQLLATDIERKTLHMVLARPVTRLEVIAGKYLGLVAVLLLNLLGSTVLYLLVAAGGPFTAPTLARVYSILFLFFEFMLAGAFALMFASLANTNSAAIYSVLLFVVGRLGRSMAELADRFPDSIYRGLSSGMMHALPDLTRFDLDAQLPMPPGSAMLGTGLYALLWSGAFLLLAALAFGQRDLK
ncbi:MAG: ABC transporter permease subunit [Pseudomonadota bacterium]